MAKSRLNWFARLDRLLDALDDDPAVSFVNCVLVSEDAERIDEDLERDILDDGGFTLEGGMKGFFDEVQEVHMVWEHAALNEQFGHPVVFGRLDVGLIDDIVFSGYSEDELKMMGPRDDAERALLLEMRHIDTHDCAGDHWLALRPDAAGFPKVWWRSPACAGTDIPLVGDFGTAMDLMIQSRGALGWPLLLADLESVDDEQRTALLHDISADAAALHRRLEVLGTLEGAASDATELLERLDQLVMTSARRFV